MRKRFVFNIPFLFLSLTIILSSMFILTSTSNNLLSLSKQSDATRQHGWYSYKVFENTGFYQSLSSQYLNNSPWQTVNEENDIATASINFTLKWSASVGISSTLQPLMHDVDADGVMEIFLIGTTDGTLTGPARLICIKGDTGALVYQKDIDSGTGGGRHRPLVIADAFNDGRYQIFYSGNGYGTNMTCIWATNGTMLWYTTLAGSQYHIFSVADTDRTGHPYVYIVKSGDANPPTNGKVFKLWATNGTIKSQSPGYEYHCSNGGISIGDANFDGEDEIYVTDRYGIQSDGYMANGLHCYNDDLQLQWNSSVPASSLMAVLADVIPGNNQLEIVVGYQGTNGVENSGIRVIYANGTTVLGKSSSDLDLSIHDQPAVYDVDKDGNLEFFTCMGTNMKAWDLTLWSLDKDFGFVSYFPPVIANVLGDADKEVVSPSGSGLRVFDSSYTLVDSLSISVSTLIVQDIDNDGLNEIITHEQSPPFYYINAYDTPAVASTPLPNTRTPYYGDMRQNVENPDGLLNVPPVADFIYTINELSVTFNASSSYDMDGYITTWLWDFGDGVEAAGEIVTHHYRSSGTYNVTLIVRDDDSVEASIAKKITLEKEFEFLTVVIFGRITNRSGQGDFITFEAVKTRVITFSPFSFKTYISGERFILSKDYLGLINLPYIFALCEILI